MSEERTPSSPPGDEHRQALLKKDEQIVWSGRPDTFAVFLHAGVWILFVSILSGGVFFLVSSVFLEGPTFRTVSTGLFFVLLTIVILGGCISYLIARHLHQNIEFISTDRRVVQVGGRNGCEVTEIQWSNVRKVEVLPGWIGSICNTGTIRFIVTEFDEQEGSPVSFLFRHVSAPHQSLERIQSGKPLS